MPELSDLKPLDPAPDFSLPRDGGDNVSLSGLKGQTVVLFFYPRDNTPGCTRESTEFSERLQEFAEAGAQVFGISADSLASHAKFTAKQGLTVALLSDENNAVCAAYGVWKEKNNYGRKYMGIERSTFVIGPDGRLAEIWRKVKVAGHVDAVLTAVKSL